MKRVWTCLTVIAWLCAARGVAGGDDSAGSAFTNKLRFRIPFRYDAAELQLLQAREVQLYLSTDQGTRWRMVDKVDPRSNHFDFLAPGDGEYWFAVRTLDAFNRLHPQGKTFEPGLKLVVDATAPVLEINLTEVEPGKVELRWSAADDHLDATKLRLEYRQPDAPNWQQVGVVPQPSGQTSWNIPGGGVVAVRGSISDAAGNTATAEKELKVRPSDPGSRKGSDTQYRNPVARSDDSSGPGPAGETQKDAEQGTPAPADRSSQRPIAAKDRSTPPSRTPEVDPFDENSAPSQAPSETRPEFGQFDGGSDSGPRIRPKAKNNFISDSPETRPAIVQKPQAPAIHIGPSSGAASPEEFAAPGVHADRAPSPPARHEPRTILVNNREFQIGYRVDDVGPSGVGKVELFITQDGGGKWYRYGSDPDNQSPFIVSVPADGVYGFDIRVKNGAGVGDDPPRPGDAPTIVVTVDKTNPVAALLPAQVGRGSSHNKILIRWTASDDHLGPEPILLEYAAQPNGPWQKIGDWQANSGRYIWSLGDGLPGKVYLRVTARDEAGNTASASSAEALVIDFVRPTARIVDVEAKSPEQPRN